MNPGSCIHNLLGGGGGGGHEFDPGLLKSFGWDFKLRSCIHMTLAVEWDVKHKINQPNFLLLKQAKPEDSLSV